MKRNVLFSRVEQFRDLKLRKPDAVILGAELNLAFAVFGRVEDEHL